MRSQNIIVSTTSTLDGWDVKSHLEVIAAHVVAGTNLFSDVFASFSDFFGGRSQSYQKQLSAINQEAIKQLKQEAANLGANCIIGLSIDHDEISGSGKSMFMVTVSGTAVIAERLKSEVNGTEISKSNLNAENLNKLIEREKIITAAKNNKLSLDKSNWKFIIENQISEVAPYILKSADSYISLIGERADKKRKRLKDYFYSISSESAKNHLYNAIRGKDNDLKNYAYNLLKEMAMLDYKQATAFLNDDNFEHKKEALGILQFNKSFYTKDDIDKLEEFKLKIENIFEERGKVVEVEKTFSSKTEKKWECECGKQNKLDDKHCSKCYKDIHGFRKEEITPQNTIDTLEIKIEMLDNYFSSNGTKKAV